MARSLSYVSLTTPSKQPTVCILLCDQTDRAAILVSRREWLRQDIEVVGYGILDIAAKSVFGLMLIFSREALDEALQKRARLSLN